jgi:hypothetical protein
MPRPPTSDRVGWRNRLESEPPWQAAPQMGDRASADSLRWNLDTILHQRGADMAMCPGGGESGIPIREHIDPIALFVYGGGDDGKQVAGGRVMFIREFMADARRASVTVESTGRRFQSSTHCFVSFR